MTPIDCRTLATVILGLVVVAQSPSDGNATRAAAAKRLAERMAKAVVDGDCETFATLTHPTLVEEMGGRQEMVIATKAAMEGLEKKGFRIVTYSVETPESFASNGKTLYTVVPTRIEMGVPGGRLIARSYLIGVSSDAGSNWTFVSEFGKPERIKKSLPDLPATLNVPASRKPQFVKGP